MAKLSLNSVEFDITPKSLSIAHTAPSPTTIQKLCHPQLYPAFLRIFKSESGESSETTFRTEVAVRSPQHHAPPSDILCGVWGVG